MNVSAANNTAPTLLTAEVDKFYLTCQSTDTALLTAFPRIAAVFRKYNAAMPSSAAVERLFSTAGQILTARRWKKSDNLFEQAVFLRYELKRVNDESMGPFNFDIVVSVLHITYLRSHVMNMIT